MTTVVSATPAAADVTTNSADNLRTGWYPDEPKLTPAAVGASDFGQLGSLPVAGQVYAQPVISNNVLIAATESNNIYGFDATTRAQLWTRNLGATFDARNLSCGDISPEVGITSTPVIDPATSTAYVTSKVGPWNTPNVAWYMHAFDVKTGVERAGWPVKIQGTADNDPTVTFNAVNELQRPGLLLMNGVVYAGFGGHCDHGVYQGWVAGVSTTSASVKAMWTDEAGSGALQSDGPGGGIWQSGSGLVSDASGDILLSTGNGTTPPTGPATAGVGTLGQSLVRLRVQPDGTLKMVDYFAPYDAPSLNDSDSDVGSGGPIALPPQYFGTAKYPRLTLLIGKQQYLWMNDATDLGGEGQGLNGGDKVVSRLGPKLGGVRGRPGVWPGDGGYIYLATSQSGGGQGRLQAYKYGLDGSGNPSLAQTGTSADYFGFGSGSPVITSNGTQSGSAVVWAVKFAQVYDKTQPGVGAELRAYDPVPVNGTLNLRHSFPLGQGTKFSVPAFDNGHVFIGTSTGSILEFGSPVNAPLTGSDVTFPTTTVGASANATATLTAQTTVTINSATINNAVFTLGAATPALPVTLTAGQTLTVPVTFKPTTNGQVSAALAFATSAGPVTLSVNGMGEASGPKLAQNACCISFGGVVAGGTPSTQTVTFSNEGAQDLIINSYGQPAAPFSVSGLPPVGTHLVSGQSFNASFSFAPGASQSGPFTDTFRIYTNDPTADYGERTDQTKNPGGVSLSGSAGAQGVMRITPTTVNFGSVPVGTTATQPFTVTNTGQTDLNITISKSPALGVGFAAASSLSEGDVIAAGQTVTEQVNFTPTVTGAATDTWAITGDDGGGRQDVTFNGTGVAPVPATPSLSVGDLDVTRPATGTVVANVPVRLSAPSSTAVTVKYTTKDGTALAPGDYTTAAGTLTIPAGNTVATIPVTVNSAAGSSPTATTLTVNLSAPTSASLADASGKLYLSTTYLPVSIAVGDATAASTGSTTNLTFPVTVSPAPYPGQPVTVKAITADGTALAASGDYTPVSTSLTFTNTTATQTVTVAVLHAPAAGATKTVLLTLNTASTGSNIGDTSGLGTVYTSTAPLPALSVSDTAIARPATGTAGATFTVSLSRPSPTTSVPVSYTAAAGTGFTPADFVPTSGTLTFAPGETSKTVTVPINGSTTSTGTGNVNLNLSGQSGATLADSGGKAYVVSPVVHSFISVRPATAWRGPSEDTTVNVPITLDAPAPAAITIPVSTTDGSAIAGTDYATTQTSVTFAPGTTQAFLPVTIKGNPAVTPTVSFSVVLGAATGATQVSSGTAVVTIVSHTADATAMTTTSAPVFTASSIPNTAQVGQPYDTTLSASGVPEPAYSVSSGMLPPGITLNARTGELSGTPTAGGDYTFIITASNTIGTPATTGTLEIAVTQPDVAPAFTAASPPTNTKVGTAYTYTFAASGSPAPTFAVASGTLPAGLGLNSATGVLSGSATTAGASTFTVSATNGVGSPAVTSSITISVAAADIAPAFTNASPPAGAVGAAYSYSFTASGSPAPAFAIGTGTLPAGLTLSTAGVLSGTPTTAATSTFTVTATNTAGTATTGSLSVTITPANGAPVITGATPPGATVGKAYSYTFTATGTPTPTFSVLSGTPPPGLALSTAGLLKGTPTADGTFTFSVSATNTNGADTAGPLTVVVAKAPAKPKFTASKPPTSTTTGASYSYTFAASGTPTPTYAVASGILPTGLSLNPSTGELAGSPTATGTFTFTVSASNSAGTVTTSSITVKVSVKPAFTSSAPPSTAKIGTPYSFTFTASGTPAPTFKLATGSIPSGMNLSSAGVFSGSPTKAATYTFSIKATNSAGVTTSDVYTLTTSK